MNTPASIDSDGLELRAWSVGDAPVLQAFQSEGAREPRFRPRTQVEFDWACGQNPAGARLVLARRGGQIVAYAFGLAVRTRVLGETRTFTHMLAAGLEPLGGVGQVGEGDERAWLSAARAFHAEYLRPEVDLLHYGWPGARTRELGRVHLEHERLRAQSLLMRDTGSGASAASPLVRALVRFGPEADLLYASCATHWNASAIRDAAFLNWRFAEHPRHRYRLLGVQSGQTLRGYAVLRRCDELGPRQELLLDWLVLPGDEEAAENLLAAALAGARANGAGVLVAAFPEWSPWSLWFQERGFLHHSSERVEVVRAAAPRFDMLWLRDNWWTTLGDAQDL